MVSLLIVVVLAALIFDYINGFHDAANAIATVVSTGVLPMRTAVLIAGVLNFIGAMAGTAVANTIAKGFADPADVTQVVVLGALTGACIWNLITWYYGIPSSSSHAIIGGLAGAVVAHAGVDKFKWAALYEKFAKPLVLSPVVGFFAAFFFMIALYWFFRWWRSDKVNEWSRRMQLVSACTVAFAHGTNDAQKSMGIITMALAAFAATKAYTLPTWIIPEGWHGDSVPKWVVISCALAMGLGTMAGGKRIIKTMGTRIIRITPLQGFAAETASAAVMLTCSHIGVPISTTHSINACIMGVGASKRLSAVRWGVATNIVIAWILTLPATAAIAWISYLIFRAIFGT